MILPWENPVDEGLLAGRLDDDPGLTGDVPIILIPP